MFEYEKDIVDALLSENKRFEELYNQHRQLKEQVRDAEMGVTPLDDLALGRMKKEKLKAKDRMAAMITAYRREHSTA
ncbi:MAG: YdcH family protein [Gammaproteobacteria bacterium]